MVKGLRATGGGVSEVSREEEIGSAKVTLREEERGKRALGGWSDELFRVVAVVAALEVVVIRVPLDEVEVGLVAEVLVVVVRVVKVQVVVWVVGVEEAVILEVGLGKKLGATGLNGLAVRPWPGDVGGEAAKGGSLAVRELGVEAVAIVAVGLARVGEVRL